MDLRDTINWLKKEFNELRCLFNKAIANSGSSVVVVDNVSNIAALNAYKGTAPSLIVSEPVRGGEFTLYTGTSPVDDGVVFSTATGAIYKRVIENNYININWFGAVSTADGSVDNYPMFTKALTATKNKEFVSYPNLYVPASIDEAHFYYCSAKLVLTTGTNIFGDGYLTHIKFQQDVGGIFIPAVTGRKTTLMNLRLESYGTLTAMSSTSYGIESKDVVYCENVTVQHFGMGFYLNNDLGSGTPGNSNNSRFINCHAYENKVFGMYIKGGDANNMVIDGFDAVANGGAGIFDASFLGNKHLNHHSASNSSPEIVWQQSLCSYLGHIYTAIQENTVGHLPTDPAYWYTSATLDTWSVYPSVLAYDNTKVYNPGGGWYIVGSNQYGTLIGCYAESDQPPCFIDQRMVSVNDNATYRDNVMSAVLRANTGRLESIGEIFSGDSGNSTIKRSYISNTDGVGVVIQANTGIAMDYDATKHVGVLKTPGIPANVASFLLTTNATTAGDLFRTNAAYAGAMFLRRAMYISSYDNRDGAVMLDLATSSALPAGTGYDRGDMFLLNDRYYFHFFPEKIIGKNTDPTQSTVNKFVIITGFAEFPISATGTTVLSIDNNIVANRGIMYDVTFAGSSAADDCVIQRRVLIRNTAGTVAIKNSQTIGTDYVPGGFATTNFQFGVSGDDITVSLINVPAGTNGKVHLKRIDY